MLKIIRGQSPDPSFTFKEIDSRYSKPNPQVSVPPEEPLRRAPGVPRKMSEPALKRLSRAATEPIKSKTEGELDAVDNHWLFADKQHSSQRISSTARIQRPPPAVAEKESTEPQKPDLPLCGQTLTGVSHLWMSWQRADLESAVTSTKTADFLPQCSACYLLSETVDRLRDTLSRSKRNSPVPENPHQRVPILPTNASTYPTSLRSTTQENTVSKMTQHENRSSIPLPPKSLLSSHMPGPVPAPPSPSPPIAPARRSVTFGNLPHHLSSRPSSQYQHYQQQQQIFPAQTVPHPPIPSFSTSIAPPRPEQRYQGIQPIFQGRCRELPRPKNWNVNRNNGKDVQQGGGEVAYPGHEYSCVMPPEYWYIGENKEGNKDKNLSVEAAHKEDPQVQRFRREAKAGGLYNVPAPSAPSTIPNPGPGPGSTSAGKVGATDGYQHDFFPPVPQSSSPQRGRKGCWESTHLPSMQSVPPPPPFQVCYTATRMDGEDEHTRMRNQGVGQGQEVGAGHARPCGSNQNHAPGNAYGSGNICSNGPALGSAAMPGYTYPPLPIRVGRGDVQGSNGSGERR